jgi:hypothetical protein
MKLELEDTLLRKYPKLYSNCFIVAKNLMHFGLEVGDGWYDLLDKLSAKLESFNKDRTVVTAVQVKEKFGGLRFYISFRNIDVEASIDNKIYKLIGNAEAKSLKICEQCGKAGAPSKSGWIKTLCKKCSKS